MQWALFSWKTLIKAAQAVKVGKRPVSMIIDWAGGQYWF